MKNDDDKITFNRDSKFDIQLAQGQRTERRLADILKCGKIQFIEVKKEDWLWERTGNIAIEYECRGKPSGISLTKADFWVHALEREGEPLCWFMFPVEKLRELVCVARLRGRCRERSGDRGQSKLALISLADLLESR